MFDSPRYLIYSKNNVLDITYDKYMKTKINLEDDLHLEETLELYKALIFIKSAIKMKNGKEYCPQVFRRMFV